MDVALRHVVLGVFTSSATAEQIDAMLAALRALPAKIPQIVRLEVGHDAGVACSVGMEHGFCLNVDFACAADYKTYATVSEYLKNPCLSAIHELSVLLPLSYAQHPDHVSVISDFIKPILQPGSRIATQFPLSAASTPLKFYIFGHPVAMSPSPDIHNIGFARNGLTHRYERFDTEDAAEVIRMVKSAGCGGGSVTIPHKESVIPHMDELTESAQAIGAVNTITKLPDGRLRGDNTDWLGIKNQLEAKAPATRPSGGALVALICGAGGTAKAAAFALRKMGATRVLIFNRTVERAQKLAEEFGFEAIVRAPHPFSVRSQ